MKLIVSIVILLVGNSIYSQGISERYFKEGNKEYLKKFYDESAANYFRALQAGGDVYKVNYNLGNSLFRLKKYEEAVFQYTKSVEKATAKGDMVDAYFNLGDSYFKSKKYEQAAEAFKKVLILDPKDEKARYNYALCKAKLKNQDRQDQGQGKENQNQKDSQSDDRVEESPNANQPDNMKNNNYGQSVGNTNNKIGAGSEKENGEDLNTALGKEIRERDEEVDYEGLLKDIGEKEKSTQQRIINKKIRFTEGKTDKDW